MFLLINSETNVITNYHYKDKIHNFPFNKLIIWIEIRFIDEFSSCSSFLRFRSFH